MALLELSSPLLYPTLFGKEFSRTRIRDALAVSDVGMRNTGLGNKKTFQWQANHILHPYLGFVANPGIYSHDAEFSRDNQTTVVNEEGFLGDSPTLSKGPNEVVIVILGGSFAMNFYLDARDKLIEELRRSERFKNKKIRVISLSMSGYKQPQQLLALSYFLSLGADFDIVINLDGFNEVVLPFADNLRSNVYPFYPRFWQTYVSGTLDVETAVQFGNLIQAKQQREQLRSTFSNSPLSSLNFGLITWEALDSRLKRRIRQQSASLAESIGKQNSTTTTRSYERFGPRPPIALTQDAILAKLVDNWANCSIQMNALGRTNDFEYFHFLQPNQYVTNSKEFTNEEEKHAYYKGGDYNYKTYAEKGYPLLITKGKDLSRQNVAFKDLTMVFKQSSETVYEDMCCHINRHGNEIVAEAIAATILKYHSNHNQ